MCVHLLPIDFSNTSVLRKGISGNECLTPPCNSTLSSCSVVPHDELLSRIREFPEAGLRNTDPCVRSLYRLQKHITETPLSFVATHHIEPEGNIFGKIHLLQMMISNFLGLIWIDDPWFFLWCLHRFHIWGLTEASSDGLMCCLDRYSSSLSWSIRFPLAPLLGQNVFHKSVHQPQTYCVLWSF